jgi:hypothetical protein
MSTNNVRRLDANEILTNAEPTARFAKIAIAKDGRKVKSSDGNVTPRKAFWSRRPCMTGHKLFFLKEFKIIGIKKKQAPYPIPKKTMIRARLAAASTMETHRPRAKGFRPIWKTVCRRVPKPTPASAVRMANLARASKGIEHRGRQLQISGPGNVPGQNSGADAGGTDERQGQIPSNP